MTRTSMSFLLRRACVTRFVSNALAKWQESVWRLLMAFALEKSSIT